MIHLRIFYLFSLPKWLFCGEDNYVKDYQTKPVVSEFDHWLYGKYCLRSLEIAS